MYIYIYKFVISVTVLHPLKIMKVVVNMGHNIPHILLNKLQVSYFGVIFFFFVSDYYNIPMAGF